MENGKDIPHIWEILLIAAVPTLAFIGWAIRVFAPTLFE